MKSMDPLQIPTPLNRLSAWLDDMARPWQRQLLVVYEPDERVLAQIVALTADRHRMVRIDFDRRLTLVQSLRKIVDAAGLDPTRRTGFDLHEQLERNPGPRLVRFTVKPDRNLLLMLAELADAGRGPYLACSTRRDLVEVVMDRTQDNRLGSRSAVCPHNLRPSGIRST